MDKFRWKLQNFMYGRNGLDDLNKLFMTLSVVLMVVSMFTGNGIVYYFALLVMILYFYRFFSKKIADRQRENLKYLHFINLSKMKFDQRKEYKFFRCRSCGKNIRVPRKKGKIEVTCPVCGNKKICRT